MEGTTANIETYIHFFKNIADMLCDIIIDVFDYNNVKKTTITYI